MGMQLQDLEVFLAVARRGTLAAAVDDVHRTPSALSKRIRRLEEALGAELFDRSGARLQLSPAGERLRARAQHLVDLGRELERDARGPAAPIAVIGGPSLLLWRFSPDLVRRFRAAFPQGRVDLRSMYEADAAAAVAQGTIDLAIVTAQVPAQAPSLEALEWGHLDLVVAGGRVDEGADATPTLARLAVSPMCGRTPCADRVHTQGGDAMGAADVVADDLLVLAELVRAGLATAELPAFIVERFELKAQRSASSHNPLDAVRLLRRSATAPWLTPTVRTACAA